MLLIFALTITAPVAFANEQNLKAELNSTYAKLLETPSDISLNLHYADVAIEMKDYETAIPPLERILFYNPSLADVKVKLGTLYFLLGSHEVAKTYLLDAKKSPAATKETLAKADDYLGRIDKAGAK